MTDQRAPQQQFTEWFDLYRQDKDPSIMPARSVAQAAFLAGVTAGATTATVVEERVRTERNELAEHLRRVVFSAERDHGDAIDAAAAYLRQIGGL